MDNTLAPTTTQIDPAKAVDFGSKSAKILSKLVRDNGWVSRIQGKDYLQFEAWQTLARFYGLSVKTVETKFVTYGSAQGFEARSVVVNSNGIEVGGAEALCLNNEPNWKNKPLYSLKSMAQTRASAKALRQILAWVVVLAGYSPTPKEEMDGVFVENKTNAVDSRRDKLVAIVIKLAENGRVTLKKPTNQMSLSELETTYRSYMNSIGK